jgi:hypothetical protein
MGERPRIRDDEVPSEEDISTADVAERLDEEPDEQLNRPDQPDASPAERRQYEDPPEDR